MNLGGREWVTFIAGINAAGWSIPPFLIFTGKHYLSAWYEEAEIPRDWVIVVSDNGWTNNELGVAWIKHFDAHTKTRVPLDVGCFSPLKRAYSREVESLIRYHINHITKLEFLPAFKVAFD
ncbi:hypothetical protein COCSADRAFT_163186 [Bipolaris sorokiniana ND90Pr]|uniref:DDE-1 domain-containing protein n=1 Tax=Cochliobolus sativus (strain ND90Pr / ATCC 201652) TaxID=665912 RepID=M2SUK9_COCSN|nr:uncharacterized protein COCSADRAFT_163186 [Bipolaris sorokiniana ND90Pr]EMD60751.1 hypothetical protein COCSADRAFT_163186 [Bipolaris sorokiniana ND90Pr]